jgi:hypothetical protein
LDVVYGDDHRAAPREERHAAAEGERNRPRVRSHTAGADAQKRNPEGALLWRRQLGEDVCQDILQEVGEPRKGEPGLRRTRSGLEHSIRTVMGEADAFAPQGRLSDPCPAFDDERGRGGRDVVEKARQLGQLRLSADDIGRRIAQSASRRDALSLGESANRYKRGQGRRLAIRAAGSERCARSRTRP